jgi:hypothetical protein
VVTSGIGRASNLEGLRRNAHQASIAIINPYGWMVIVNRAAAEREFATGY